MKTYRVWAKCVSFCFIDVEANSEDEAWEIAKEADGGEFEDDPTSGYWEQTDVELINSEER